MLDIIFIGFKAPVCSSVSQFTRVKDLMYCVPLDITYCNRHLPTAIFIHLICTTLSYNVWLACTIIMYCTSFSIIRYYVNIRS